MKPIKVLFVIRSLLRSGAERISLDICDELNKRKEIEVLFVSMSKINEYQEITKNIPFKVINSKVLPKIIKKSIVEIDEYKRIIDEFKPDIVHSHLFWSELLTREYTKPGITYVSHCHDNMIEFRNFSLKTIFNKLKLARFFEKKWMIRKYSKCNNYFLTISTNSEKYYKSVLPKKLQKIKLLPNAISLKKFDTRLESEKNNLTEKLKLITVGTLFKLKNHSFLLDVIKELKNKKINVELNILGDGPEKNNLQHKINHLNLQTTVKLVGNVKNVENYLRNSDIYIHSSLSEAFGLVFIEAMAAGLPIVSLNGGGNKDLIKNDFNGYILDKPNVKLFIEKILQIKNNTILYNKLSKNAIEFSKRFSIESYADKLIKWYKKILHENK